MTISERTSNTVYGSFSCVVVLGRPKTSELQILLCSIPCMPSLSVQKVYAPPVHWVHEGVQKSHWHLCSHELYSIGFKSRLRNDHDMVLMRCWRMDPMMTLALCWWGNIVLLEHVAIRMREKGLGMVYVALHCDVIPSACNSILEHTPVLLLKPIAKQSFKLSPPPCLCSVHMSHVSVAFTTSLCHSKEKRSIDSHQRSLSNSIDGVVNIGVV